MPRRGDPAWEDRQDMTLSELKQAVATIILAKGHLQLEQPVKLASGDWSRDYIDGKRAFAKGSDLRLAGEALLRLVEEQGWDFDAVGGLTLGADQFSHVVAVLADRSWFVVRKKEKDHGTKSRIEGARLGDGVKVLLVDDVVTRGGSVLEAFHAVRQTGAEVVGVTAIVDRGPATSAIFADLGVPYRPLLTYADLGIAPVGGGEGTSQATG
jgi:orotate phosphoribosyltransferase